MILVRMPFAKNWLSHAPRDPIEPFARVWLSPAPSKIDVNSPRPQSSRCSLAEPAPRALPGLKSGRNTVALPVTGRVAGGYRHSYPGRLPILHHNAYSRSHPPASHNVGTADGKATSPQKSHPAPARTMRAVKVHIIRLQGLPFLSTKLNLINKIKHYQYKG